MRSILSFAVAAVAGDAPAPRAAAAGGSSAGADGRPHVVVTTSILGDIVRQVLGEHADVEVIMPVGADPHEFSPSTRQAEAMQDADLLVVNGAGLEQSMADVIDGAGRRLHVRRPRRAADARRQPDPHLWNDPHAIAGAVAAFGAAWSRRCRASTAPPSSARSRPTSSSCEALDAEIDDARWRRSRRPAARSSPTTSSFGYFADRYDFG